MSPTSIAGLTIRPGSTRIDAEDPEHTGPRRNGQRQFRLEERRPEQLRTLPDPQTPDLVRATAAVADLLGALGVDPTSKGLHDTPERVARAYAEALTPEPFEATTFPNDEGYDELVVARSMPFSSLCEHHLLPFAGVAHVGYLPADRLIGLSKIARTVEYFSRRLQTQERLTKQIADWLASELQPKGVGVVVEAEHACMSMRGVRATGAHTVTSALRGVVREDGRSRNEFFALARPDR
jgi:GTP cyclohydrolase IA